MSPARRRALTAAGFFSVALAGYLAWPLLIHDTALAILHSRSAELSRQAPDFSLPDSRGGSLKLSDYRGKVVLLNFWATWCGPCKTEIPWFEEFQNQLGPAGFTVVGVSMDESGWNVVKPFMAEQRMNYPVGLANEEVNILYGGIESLPTTLLIGRDGKIAYMHSGLVPKDQYLQEIHKLLDIQGQI